jgi:hypothetical protein
MSEPADPRVDVAEFPDAASYGWWRNSHPRGFILSVRARRRAVLHRATCRDVDRDRKPGALTARGSRQLCAEDPAALRAWVAANEPESGPVLERCPKCSP